jgi:hypothetical protein
LANFNSFPNFSENEHLESQRNDLNPKKIESEIELYTETGALMDDAENDYFGNTDLEKMKLEIMKIEEDRERREKQK